jgi:hypothetical protein
MRWLSVLTAVVGLFVATEGLPVRADAPGMPQAGTAETVVCPSASGRPIRVVVHVQKPEIVYEEAGSGDAGQAKESRLKHFFCKPKKVPNPPPQAIATIVAPTAALVPAPTTAVVTSHAPCNNFGNSMSADEAAMRATHDMEMALASLSAARAAQKARLDAADAALSRVTAATAQVTQNVKSSTLSPGGDGKAPTLDTLNQRLQTLQERVGTLQKLVEQHHQLLKEKYPDSFKSTGK